MPLYGISNTSQLSGCEHMTAVTLDDAALISAITARLAAAGGAAPTLSSAPSSAPRGCVVLLVYGVVLPALPASKWSRRTPTTGCNS